ncbi:MAG TPA: tRNA (adenosine(37)-N6)-threonylcarbamoyltransferase complex transferase subunit TsaD [Fibrobacteria bacterium]|nr:tRNA (adenosine(37)-N6)-threonylcarbamoyltransferase complex transferase subunit TsaD [Fibrobacteria bacterium]
MLILGIETSCDETAAAVIDGWRVLSNFLHTQEVHAEFGGVVPEIASREHLRLLPGIVRQALDEAGTSIERLDGIAYTRGPGLAGPLLVGASFAQALAMDAGKPLWGANHLEGHLAAVRLTDPTLNPPFLCLTVSGGHTELTEVTADGRFLALGATRDDAAGEAFDKCGKILGLGYPAGPEVSRLAAQGNRKAFPLPVGLRGEGLDFSFSGLKTALGRLVKELGDGLPPRLNDVCASLEEAIVDALVAKCRVALDERNLPGVAVCGGVSANRRLRERMQHMAERSGKWARFPSPSLCTDNGAMIAGAALWRLERGETGPLEGPVDPGLALGN